MRFGELVSHLDDIRGASLIQAGRLAQELLCRIQDPNLPGVAAIMSGSFKEYRPLPEGLVERALATASGWSLGQVKGKLRRIGDLPHVAEVILHRRRQLKGDDDEPSVEEALMELEALFDSKVTRRAALLRLTKLLSHLDPPSARAVLQILLRQAKPYLRESALVDVFAERLGVEPEEMRRLRRSMGWRRAVTLLLGDLPCASEGIVWGPGNCEEGRN